MGSVGNSGFGGRRVEDFETKHGLGFKGLGFRGFGFRVRDRGFGM